MSALALVLTPGGIFIAGDGISYERTTGAIGCINEKIVGLGYLNCAIASIGVGGFSELVHADLIKLGFTTFDEVLDHLPNICRSNFEDHVEFYGLLDVSATLAIAGWSEGRQQYESYKVHSHHKPLVDAGTGAGAGAAEPWTLIPITDFWASNYVSLDDMRAVGFRLDGLHEPQDLAVALVCAARQRSGFYEPSNDSECEGIPPHPSTVSGGHYAVGGFVQLVLLRKGVTVSWIAHRWPDELFKTVDKDAGEKAPPFPIKLEV